MVLYSEGGGSSGGEEAGKGKFQSAGGSAKTSTGLVYMGMGQPVTSGGGIGGTGLRPAAPQYLSKNEAYTIFDTMGGKQLADFIAKGQIAGQLGENDGIMEARKLWKNLVDTSSYFTRAGQDISPYDILASYLGTGPLKGKQLGGEALWQTQFRGGRKFLVNTQTGEVKYQGPRFETVYQKSIDLTDPATAKAVATSVYQQLMHRDPGKGELSGFSEALRTAEQASPAVTETTTEYDPNTGEAIGTSSVSSGGLTPEGRQYLAEQRIKKTKEYGQVQAATYYGPALENAIFNNPFGSL